MQLEFIDLSHHRMGASCAELIETIRKSETLKKINIDGNNMSLDDLRQLDYVISSTQRIVYVKPPTADTSTLIKSEKDPQKVEQIKSILAQISNAVNEVFSFVRFCFILVYFGLF